MHWCILHPQLANFSYLSLAPPYSLGPRRVTLWAPNPPNPTNNLLPIAAITFLHPSILCITIHPICRLTPLVRSDYLRCGRACVDGSQVHNIIAPSPSHHRIAPQLRLLTSLLMSIFGPHLTTLVYTFPGSPLATNNSRPPFPTCTQYSYHLPPWSTSISLNSFGFHHELTTNHPLLAASAIVADFFLNTYTCISSFHKSQPNHKSRLKSRPHGSRVFR